MKKDVPNLILLIVIMFSASIYAQNKQLWSKKKQNETLKKELVLRKNMPKKANYYQLDLENLKQNLKSAPLRSAAKTDSDLVLYFPTKNGLESFKIKEASVLAQELQNQYPNLRSYIGQGIENPSSLIRFSVTTQGLHAMILSEHGTEYIDPYTKNDNIYIAYKKSDLPALDNAWECGVVDETNADKTSNFNVTEAKNANDGQLRTFRLAVACTVEYSSFHWSAAGLTQNNTEDEKKAAVLAAVVVTMTRINGIYEKDLSLTMTLVPNNTDIIFINSDNFNNGSPYSLIDQNQTVIDNIIGSSNYDIGHNFSTGGGGLASLNSPCTYNKASGVTGLRQPVGDHFDVDYVSHEMGHQFGAPHTFNGNASSCGGNRSSSSAYEPGSGSTIMSYAGICSPQNVQSHSDDYFHQRSLQLMWENISNGYSQCAEKSSTGNSAPTANAGNDYTIPKLTPYMLTGSSTDPDGTATHTYTWEQYDLGSSGYPSEENTSAPMVRSFKGTRNPTRYIPQLEDIISNGGVSTDWEKLPAVSRTQDFRLTVRDNGMSGGQTAVDEMTTTVSTSSGPFRVTSQNTNNINWLGETTETITWDVANTNYGSVNTPNVDILLSVDGGLNFNTPLATNVPNNGSYTITVPNIQQQNCRIMVKGNGNIFFNINSEDFSITENNVAGINTFNLENNLSVFPNPNQGEFSIKFKSNQNNTVSISVFDIRGRIIMNKSYTKNGDFNQTINLGNVKSGIYLLNINDDIRNITTKIIVK